MTDWDAFIQTLSHDPLRVSRRELLCEFSAADGMPLAFELRFHGETFACWEAVLLERGQFRLSRSTFQTRAATVEWAEGERLALEGEREGR